MLFRSLFVSAPIRTPGHGIFRDIVELKAGHCASFHPSGFEVKRYWQLESRPHTDDWRTTVDTVASLLRDTVSRQLVSDVPLAALLSGGLDSSGITALAAGRIGGGEALRTFSVSFEGDRDYFEANVMQRELDGPWIERMTAHLGTRHDDLRIGPEQLIELLYLPVTAHDLPASGETETSLYLLFKHMKRTHTVALSGEGADEVFGGYGWFSDDRQLHAPVFPWSRVEGRTALLSSELKERIDPMAYAARARKLAEEETPALRGESDRDAAIRRMF